MATSKKLPPNPFMHEILELVSKARTIEKKADILKEYETDAMKALLIWNFDPTVVSVVPDGDVPYNRNEAPLGTDHTTLRKEWKNLYHFVKGGNDGLSGLRRETMFIQMLEGLHPSEAEIVCLVKDKKIETKYKLSIKVVEKAYPDIQWGGRS